MECHVYFLPSNFVNHNASEKVLLTNYAKIAEQHKIFLKVFLKYINISIYETAFFLQKEEKKISQTTTGLQSGIHEKSTGLSYSQQNTFFSIEFSERIFRKINMIIWVNFILIPLNSQRFSERFPLF